MDKFKDMTEEELKELIEKLTEDFKLKYEKSTGKFRYNFVPNLMLGRVKDSYLPWYDEFADYNTNAKSYYDYLARYNKILQAFEELINRSLNRNITIEDTESIDFIKEGDWIDNGECFPENYDDVINLKAHVIISKVVKSLPIVYLGDFDVPNGSETLNDGVWSPDYKNVLDEIGRRLKFIDEELERIENKFDTAVENINNRINNLEGGLQNIINNLFESGAITTNNINTYEFKNNRDLATGNINLFGGTADGTSFIRTNSGSTNNDITAGYWYGKFRN